MHRVALVMFVLLSAVQADAQIVRPRFQLSSPSAWVSAGLGLQNAFTVRDGETGSSWQFGSATPIGVSIEKAFASGITAGIRGSTTQASLRYEGAATTYAADARVSQLLGSIRLASGQGFHTVLELNAGVTYFSEFRTQDQETRLAPMSGDQDFTFSFGYGFGYSFNNRFSVDAVQDVTTMVHQKNGLSPSDDASNRVGSTRIVARIGLGSR